MEKNYKSLSAIYGAYLGIALTLITVLVYAFSPTLFTEWWLSILLFILIIGIAVMAVRSAKKVIVGFMSFKEAFTAYFITIVVGTLISTIVGIILFNFVDPETAEFINEQMVQMQSEMMASFGAPQEQIDKVVAELEKENQFAITSYLKSYFTQLAIYAVIGLIIALIFREKDPQAA